MQPEIGLDDGDVSIHFSREKGRGQVVDIRGI